jgi:hypothetical protein
VLYVLSIGSRFGICPFTLVFIDCGNIVSNGGAPAPASDCSMACSGNSSEICGGPNRLNVYNNTASSPPPPSTTPIVVPSSGPWVSLGCYRYFQLPFFPIESGPLRHLCLPISDNVGGRALTFGTPPVGGASNNSVESCTAACFTAGYSLAGMEYSDECCTFHLSAQDSTFVHSPCFL